MIHEVDVPHRSPRPIGIRGKISAIVLHDTGSKTAISTLTWFQDPTSQVSSHYLIDRDGAVFRCVPDAEKAWHAGWSELWGVQDVNTYSIGIELVDITNDPYPEVQLAAAVDLCAALCQEYGIWLNRIIGHEHVALPHGRKTDPGPDFPWDRFLREVARGLDRLSGEG